MNSRINKLINHQTINIKFSIIKVLLNNFHHVYITNESVKIDYIELTNTEKRKHIKNILLIENCSGFDDQNIYIILLMFRQSNVHDDYRTTYYQQSFIIFGWKLTNN